MCFFPIQMFSESGTPNDNVVMNKVPASTNPGKTKETTIRLNTTQKHRVKIKILRDSHEMCVHLQLVIRKRQRFECALWNNNLNLQRLCVALPGCPAGTVNQIAVIIPTRLWTFQTHFLPFSVREKRHSCIIIIFICIILIYYTSHESFSVWTAW